MATIAHEQQRRCKLIIPTFRSFTNADTLTVEVMRLA